MGPRGAKDLGTQLSRKVASPGRESRMGDCGLEFTPPAASGLSVLHTHFFPGEGHRLKPQTALYRWVPGQASDSGDGGRYCKVFSEHRMMAFEVD